MFTSTSMFQKFGTSQNLSFKNNESIWILHFYLSVCPTPPHPTHHKQKKTPKNAEQTLSHQLCWQKPSPPILAWDLRQPSPPQGAPRNAPCVPMTVLPKAFNLPVMFRVPARGWNSPSTVSRVLRGGWCCWVWLVGWLGGREVGRLIPNKKPPRKGCKDGQGW